MKRKSASGSAARHPPRQAAADPVAALWACLHAGQLAQAHRLCRTLEAQGSAEDARVLHARGMLALAEGEHPRAVATLRASLARDPDNALAHYHLGRVLRSQGDLPGALAHYEHSIALDPSRWEAHSSRGVLLRAFGRFKEAVQAYRTALQLQPDAAEAWLNLGNALFSDNRATEAIEAYRQLLARQPTHAAARRGLLTAQAYAFLEERQWEQARALYAHLVAEHPDTPALQNGLAVALWQLGDIDGARRHLEAAHALDPGDGIACLHNGTLLNRKELWPEAIHWLEMAAARMPGFAPALIEWGIALLYNGDYAEALRTLDAACAADPGGTVAPYNRAFVHLMLGNMQQGYQDFEYRFEHGFVYAQGRPRFSMPAWKGEDLSAGHLMVWTEQGAGDALQYARYLPRLAATRPGRLSVRVHPPLEALLQHSFPELDIAAEQVALATPADFECPMMSLPLRLSCAQDFMPEVCPYLHAPPARVEAWRQRLGPWQALRIGLAWSGNPDQQRNRTRSIPLSELAGLITDYSRDGRCEFHVLQKGAGLEALDGLPGLPVRRSSDDCADFADTAALMENLDLVLTVDTSVAHLAGGLGRPTWILLARVPDWRYGVAGQDCPWYPGARVFRQPAHHDWTSVVREVRAALDELLQQRAAHATAPATGTP